MSYFNDKVCEYSYYTSVTENFSYQTQHLQPKSDVKVACITKCNNHRDINISSSDS
jgi:hypothetical protein